MDRTLPRRLFAELLGSAFLAAVVIGSRNRGPAALTRRRRTRAARERRRHCRGPVHDHRHVLPNARHDLDQAPRHRGSLLLRDHRDPRAAARDLLDRPHQTRQRRTRRRRRLHRRRVLLHQLHQFRQPGDRRRPNVLRHLRRHRPLLRPPPSSSRSCSAARSRSSRSERSTPTSHPRKPPTSFALTTNSTRGARRVPRRRRVPWQLPRRPTPEPPTRTRAATTPRLNRVRRGSPLHSDRHRTDTQHPTRPRDRSLTSQARVLGRPAR